MNVEVTETDIRAGRQGDGARCPVALAIQRCAGAEWVYVGRKIIRYGNNRDLWAAGASVAPMPEQVRRIIRYYDMNSEMWPFGFILQEAPSES
jgi:hypothetical protein